MANSEIAEIRKIRHQISAECGHDIHKVAAYYRQVQEELKKSGEFRFEEQSGDPPTVSATGKSEDAK